MCPIYGSRHDMNSCKLMKAQAKDTKLTWLNACGGGAGRVRFQGAKKRLSEGKELNDLVISAVKEVLKPKKHVKYKVAHKSN